MKLWLYGLVVLAQLQIAASYVEIKNYLDIPITAKLNLYLGSSSLACRDKHDTIAAYNKSTHKPGKKRIALKGCGLKGIIIKVEDIESKTTKKAEKLMALRDTSKSYVVEVGKEYRLFIDERQRIGELPRDQFARDPFVFNSKENLLKNLRARLQKKYERFAFRGVDTIVGKYELLYANYAVGEKLAVNFPIEVDFWGKGRFLLYDTVELK